MFGGGGKGNFCALEVRWYQNGILAAARRLGERGAFVRYWWVNQNQTFRQEFEGGYLWSPQRKSNDHRNPFYEFMREVAPGDTIFSFKDAHIPAIGIAESFCYECPKPEEFGGAGSNWSNIRWKIDVRFTRLKQPIRPSQHMAVLGPLLSAKYAPLRANGHGIQSVYLTRVEPDFAQALLMLLGHELRQLLAPTEVRESNINPDRSPAQGQVEWEEHLIDEIRRQPIAETKKAALILARRGQGVFKQRVRSIERSCRITKVERIEHLRASHCKPWRDSSDEERLNGENGLLLTPTIDHLFDRGFISFEAGGQLLISPIAHRPSLERMGVPTQTTLHVGAFSEGQRQFLKFHRERVFLAVRGGSEAC